jgi:isocitrate/isopropylmalate dehydrogenase
MLVGGLGVACSGNIGSQAAVFEPVHGSAPGLAGTHSANPIATFLSAAMLLDYTGESSGAGRLRQAVFECIAQQAVTPDLGGTLRTGQVTDRVLAALDHTPERK